MNKLELRKYAELIVKVGANIQKEDGAIITFSSEALPLVRELAKVLYEIGAKDVILRMNDDEITLAKYNLGQDYIFDLYPDFDVDFVDAAYSSNYHRIAISSPNPELLKDVDKDKQKRSQKAMLKATEKLDKHMDAGTLKWIVAAYPTVAWAKKVFPESSDEEAVEKLWESMKKIVRLDTPDPVKAWEEHESELKRRESWLDDQNFKRIRFEGPGTDISVHLAEGHNWIGGASVTPKGEKYIANIPTEEIFTAPHSHRVNGYLRATKPLSVMGNLVEDFSFVFKDGKVIEFKAGKNQEVLEGLMEMDEGASRLGEVALVPDSSPIAESGLLFMNTLFDENASCHFAIGNSYTETIIGGTEMSEEEKAAKGANKSMIHIDFMVGGPDVHVTGYTFQGDEIAILRNGEWVI
ncbi:MAG: aminopeptidase [Clostridiaceae bacterium]